MLLVAGTHSGCGKSTVTLGLLAALRRRGLAVQPFKAGPDFIDTGLHGLIAGRPSRNLDLWMCGEDYVRKCVRRHSAGADFAVAEGVMGLFDGGERSTAALAEVLGARVALVVDASGMAESAGAIIRGFRDYGRGIEGVIFNRVSSEGHFERLKAAADGMDVFGYLPRNACLEIPHRHLGLVTAEENPLGEKMMETLAEATLRHIDMEKIRLLAAVGDSYGEEEPSAGVEPSVRIAVSRDKAFCFYYEDNLDMLRQNGAEIIFFSPLADETLPPNADAVYIGGGYPELYAHGLSQNTGMLDSVREFARAGRPVYAECGGLMYLSEGIHTEGRFYGMCGVFPFRAVMNKKGEKRPVLGYRQLRLSHECVLGGAGDFLRGHEFHYSEAAPAEGKKDGDEVRYNVLEDASAGPSGQRIASAAYKATLALYAHVHFGSSAGTAANFVRYIKKGARAWR